MAAWLTSPENTQFARTIVNRVWGSLLGRGLVHPMDDLRATNPASNEELFAALTADFVEHGFDVKRLIRTIMTSATYQRSADTDATNVKDDRYYSHYLTRRLPAEVILDAFSQVTGVPTRFEGYPAGTRALQLPDTQVDSYFLTVFGRPERILTSAAERQMDPTLPQALHAINGDTLNGKLQDETGRIAALARGDGGERRHRGRDLPLGARPPPERRRAPGARRRGSTPRPTGGRSWRTSRGRRSHPGNSCSPTEQGDRHRSRACACFANSVFLRNSRVTTARSRGTGTLRNWLFSRRCCPLAAARGRAGRVAGQAPAAPDYARDVVPILEANCVRCHSPAQQEGGLLLDAYEDLVRGGDTGAVIKPGRRGGEPAGRDDRGTGEEEDAAEGRASSRRNRHPPRVDRWRRAYSELPMPPLDDKVPVARRSRAPCCRRSPALAFRPDGGELAIGGYREVRRLATGGGAAAAPALSGSARSGARRRV